MGEWEGVSSDWDVIFSYTEIRVIFFKHSQLSMSRSRNSSQIFQDLNLCFEKLIRKDMTNMVLYHNTRRLDKNIYNSINLSRAAFSFCL